MKLYTLNRYLRWFGIVLVVETGGTWIVLRLERASRWPLVRASE